MSPMLPLRRLKGARVVLAGRFGYVSRREAETLVRAHGGLVHPALSRRATALVVGALGVPIGSDGEVPPIIRRVEALNATGAAIRMLSERRLLELAGQAPPAQTLGGVHDVNAVAGMLDVDARTLEHWSHLGLIHAGRQFDFRDIVSLQTISDLINRGVDVSTIARTLVGLSRSLPDVERPLSQLRILAESPRSLVVQIHDTLQTSEGQLLLAFEPAEPREGRHRVLDAADPDELLDDALNAERDQRFDDALRLYDTIIEHRPSWADAHFNRGNVLLAMDRADLAGDAYRRAVEVDPAHATAWYNLSEAAERTADIDGAIRALRAALDVDPIFADAMYNLATLLQQEGRLEDAASMWRRYLALDASGGWADHARSALHACTVR